MTLACGCRAIVKNMAQMTAAAAAMNFGADRDRSFRSGFGAHGIRQRLPKRRPAGAAVDISFSKDRAAGRSRGSDKCRLHSSCPEGLEPARSVPSRTHHLVLVPWSAERATRHRCVSPRRPAPSRRAPSVQRPRFRPGRWSQELTSLHPIHLLFLGSAYIGYGGSVTKNSQWRGGFVTRFG